MSMQGPRVPLEQRVAAALDGAGHRTGAELIEHLRETHPDDPELVAEVVSLLELSEGGHPILDHTPMSSARTALGRLHEAIASDAGNGGTRAPGARISVPEAIGNYRIVRVLGEGGMGLVYEAEQPSPRRRVAIKVIGRGAQSRATLARFRNEAQVLGQLKHPGIAQIFEAATDSATGDAFFAMEFIDGEPLTRFAEKRRLSDRGRVELIARVCDAVQHAHQKGVIHRDIKPGNILVESGDGGYPVPKVLDFGVAKLIQGSAIGAESATLALDANRIVGTLGYMSPEQFEGKPESLDTRSDVYSLGVLLFEVLAGCLPIDVSDLSLTEAATRVRHAAPARLSKTRPALRGDLDIIANKALAKDREDRYASAAELAADLRRYLGHEPIAARAPGTFYTLRRFARRKPALTAVSVVAFASLVGATIFSSIQYRRAEFARRAEAEQSVLARQRAEAEQAARERADRAGQLTRAVKDFLLFQLLGAASPGRMGYDAKVLDVIRNAEETVGTTFADSPETEAEIRFELSRVYDTLGQWDQSVAQVDRAIEMFGRLEGPDGPRTIDALAHKTVALSNANRFDEALLIGRDALERIARVKPNDHGPRVALTASIGNMLQAQGKYDQAEPLLREGVAIAEAHLPQGNVTRINIRSTYLAMLSAMSRAEETVPQLRALLAEQEAASGTEHPLSMTTRNNLINVLLKLRRDQEALDYALPMIAQARRVFPEGHVHRGVALTTVAAVLRRNQRPGEAGDLAEEAFRNFSKASGDFEFFIEKAAEFAYLSYKQANDADRARLWGLQYIACRFRAASEEELPSLRARLIEMAQSQAEEKTDAGAAKILTALIDRADSLAPPESGRRVSYFANLARAAVLIGVPELAPELIRRSEAELPSSTRAESDGKIIRAAKSLLKEPAPTP